jgi:hypothetical protein
MGQDYWKGLLVALCMAGCASSDPIDTDTGSVVTAPEMKPPPAVVMMPPGAQPVGQQPGDVGRPPTGTAGAAAPMAGAPALPPTTTMPPGTGTAGAGTAGGAAPMMPPTDPVMPAPMGSMDPIIPAVMGECPSLEGGTITLMGLGGITIDSGKAPAMPSAPMVFYWHGTGSFAGEYSGMASAVIQGVRSEGGVLVSFQGTTGGDLLSGTAIFGAGDFKLADQLVACAVTKRNVDPRRIFATGCSAGGLFSGAMGSARANYMAAIAPNSGGLTTGFTTFQRQKMWTPALMTVHGAPGVDVVIIDFSSSSASADMAYKTNGGFVLNCNHGGVHCGGGGLAGDIWKFFKAHPYGTKPSPWATALPAGFSSQCKLY